MPEWVNWSGGQRSTPSDIAEPRTDDELADVVRRATEAGRTVRPVGSGHSFTALVPTDGVVVSLEHLAGVVSVDTAAGVAEVRAGTRIADLGDPLLAAGVALPNQGDIDRQAIAGACGTGTHGTGPTLPCLSAGVVGATVVLANGDIVDCDADHHPELFAATRLSLGATGVVARLRLRVRPAYRLHERSWTEAVADTLAALDERIAATRHYEFFWIPGTDRCLSKSLDETEAPPDPLPDERWERIDHSHRVFPSVRDDRFEEMEYAVPAEAGPECFAAIRRLYRARHPDVAWPVEYRTLAADDVWLSPAFDRPTVTISVHQGAGLDHDRLFRDCEAVFRHHEGRPHWGKHHRIPPDELAGLHPRWDDWWRARDLADPDGRFLNPMLAALAAPAR
ncbi:MAG TPA: D-arabinono-1,4-lactone oxidase [Acidimicrobiales bacterium]|nr:D-arabinono-1,4-lactone oxidase [Acidimicrobiales bacterium]